MATVDVTNPRADDVLDVIARATRAKLPDFIILRANASGAAPEGAARPGTGENGQGAGGGEAAGGASSQDSAGELAPVAREETGSSANWRVSFWHDGEHLALAARAMTARLRRRRLREMLRVAATVALPVRRYGVEHLLQHLQLLQNSISAVA